MREIFADNGYWVAMVRSDDALHSRVTSVSEDISDYRIVTTELVLVEFLNAMSKGGPTGRGLASETALRLENDRNVVVVEQTGAQFAAALERFASRLDQRWSLTDCANFLVMEQRGITEALAYDRDFEQAGFTALLRES